MLESLRIWRRASWKNWTANLKKQILRAEGIQYRWSDFGWYFADFGVPTLCIYNELQKQDEMEDSDYTNPQVHVLTMNQTTKISTKELYFFKHHT